MNTQKQKQTKNPMDGLLGENPVMGAPVDETPVLETMDLAAPATETPATPATDAPTAASVKYAKVELVKRVRAKGAEWGNPTKAISVERVLDREVCEACGSPRMKNVIVLQDSTGDFHRVGRTCAELITGLKGKALQPVTEIAQPGNA